MIPRKQSFANFLRYEFEPQREPSPDDEDYAAMDREFGTSILVRDAAAHVRDRRLPFDGTQFALGAHFAIEEFLVLCRLLAVFPASITRDATGLLAGELQDRGWDAAELPADAALKLFMDMLRDAVVVDAKWAMKMWPGESRLPGESVMMRELEHECITEEVSKILKRFWKGRKQQRFDALSTLRELVVKVYRFEVEMKTV